jgi:hypothetical protein
MEDVVLAALPVSAFLCFTRRKGREDTVRFPKEI